MNNVTAKDNLRKTRNDLDKAIKILVGSDESEIDANDYPENVYSAYVKLYELREFIEFQISVSK